MKIRFCDSCHDKNFDPYFIKSCIECGMDLCKICDPLMHENDEILCSDCKGEIG
jgi:hypothetical protein